MIPNLHFSTEEEFLEQMQEHEHAIHTRILDAVEVALLTRETDLLIAFLNDDYEMRLPITDWLTNLEQTLAYFEALEDYTKCKEIVNLTNNVKTFLGKDLDN
jgi:hypothetical protein